MSASLRTVTPTSPTYRFLVRKRLHERCVAVLQNFLQPEENPSNRISREDIIRALAAVFELQRVHLHSDLEDQQIDYDIIASTIGELASGAFLPDRRDPKLLIDMEVHLQLLASAIRLYKYNGRSLHQDIYQDVFQGLKWLSDIVDENRGRRDEKLRIEESNVIFLIRHCRFLLLSIDNSGSLGRMVAKRAILAVDDIHSGDFQYQDLRWGAADILNRHRLRPKWHDEYIHLEDACRSLFARDLRLGGSRDRDTDIEALLDETGAATHILGDAMEFHLPRPRQLSKVNTILRAVGTKKATQETGAHDEQTGHFIYGILDLLYQLSFYCRKRSRFRCFTEYVRMIRMVLERSHSSALILRSKASDLWNRIMDLGDKDGLCYGDDEDRHAIHIWIVQHLRDSEAIEYSAARSKRIELHVKELKAEVAALVRISKDDARVTPLTAAPSPVLHSGTTGGLPRQDGSSTTDARISALQQLIQTRISDEEITLIVKLLQRPDLQRRVNEYQSPESTSPSRYSVLSNVDPAQAQEEYYENTIDPNLMGPVSPVNDPETSSASVKRAAPRGMPETDFLPAQKDVFPDNSTFPRPPFMNFPNFSNPSSQVFNPPQGTSRTMIGISSETPTQWSRRISQPEDTKDLAARFTPCPPVNLLRSSYGHKSSRNPPKVAATCISGTGDTAAIVEKSEYRVYKLSRNATIRPKCVGFFEEDGVYRSGLDRVQARSHGYIMDDKKKRDFIYAAVSDTFLAAGCSGGTFLLLSIGDEESSLGKIVFKLEQPDLTIQKVIFNSENSELAVFSSIRKENTGMCQFYTVGHFPTVSKPAFEHRESFSPVFELPLDLSYQVEGGVYPYTLRDAKFSSDGLKLVAITNHIQGSAVVFVMFKSDDGQWQYWGKDQIAVHHLDNWDVNCLGFTGVCFFRQNLLDDSILLSLDFPSDVDPEDCYKIAKDFPLKLDPERRRICSNDLKSPALAMAVSSHGTYDVIAVLCRDGRIWIFQQYEKPLGLGISRNIKETDILTISEILDEVTLTFSNDGQKLIFIDNRGEPQIFIRTERRRFSRTSNYT